MFLIYEDGPKTNGGLKGPPDSHGLKLHGCWPLLISEGSRVQMGREGNDFSNSESPLALIILSRPAWGIPFTFMAQLA